MRLWNIYLDGKIVEKYNIPLYGIIVPNIEVYQKIELLTEFLIEKYNIIDEDIPDIIYTGQRVIIDDKNIANNFENNEMPEQL
jgi:hypothetical protein